MESLTILLFDILLFMIYSGLALMTGLLIQLISYKIFNFNLYKFMKYILFDKELNINE